MVQCTDAAPSPDTLLMTAYATAETAVEAMRLGAVDYLIKPPRPPSCQESPGDECIPG